MHPPVKTGTNRRTALQESICFKSSDCLQTLVRELRLRHTWLIYTQNFVCNQHKQLLVFRRGSPHNFLALQAEGHTKAAIAPRPMQVSSAMHESLALKLAFKENSAFSTKEIIFRTFMKEQSLLNTFTPTQVWRNKIIHLKHGCQVLHCISTSRPFICKVLFLPFFKCILKHRCTNLTLTAPACPAPRERPHIPWSSKAVRWQSFGWRSDILPKKVKYVLMHLDCQRSEEVSERKWVFVRRSHSTLFCKEQTSLCDIQ